VSGGRLFICFFLCDLLPGLGTRAAARNRCLESMQRPIGVVAAWVGRAMVAGHRAPPHTGRLSNHRPAIGARPPHVLARSPSTYTAARSSTTVTGWSAWDLDVCPRASMTRGPEAVRAGARVSAAMSARCRRRGCRVSEGEWGSVEEEGQGSESRREPGEESGQSGQSRVFFYCLLPLARCVCRVVPRHSSPPAALVQEAATCPRIQQRIQKGRTAATARPRRRVRVLARARPRAQPPTTAHWSPPPLRLVRWLGPPNRTLFD